MPSRGSIMMPGNLRCHRCRFFKTRNRLTYARHVKSCLNRAVSHEMRRELMGIIQRNMGSEETDMNDCLRQPEQLFRRRYECNNCEFTTMKSKEYLIHRRDVHFERLTIHQCDYCAYSNKHRFSIVRHMKIHQPPPAPTETTITQPFDDENPIPSTSGMINVQSNISELPIMKRPPKKKFMWKIRPLTKFPAESLNRKYDVQVDDDRSQSSNFSEASSKTDNFSETSSRGDNISEASQEGKGGVFQCTQCSFFTTKKIEYFAHKAGHNTPDDDVVIIEPDIPQPMILQPMKRARPQARRYKCSQCNMRTCRRSSFEKHTMYHNTKAKYKCPLCSYSSPLYPTITRHLSFHHTAAETENVSLEIKKNDTATMENITCNECGEDYNNRDVFNLHKMSHNRNTLFACEKCDMIYKRVADFSRHMLLRHQVNMGNEVYEQLVESFQVELDNDNGPLDLSLEKEAGMPAQCPFCTFEAKTNVEYEKHVVVHSSEQRHYCTGCPRSYKNKSDLRCHIRKDHPNDLDQLKLLGAGPTGVKRDHSGLNVRKSDDVRKMDDRSSQPEQKRFRCTLCSFTSLNKDETKRHIYTTHSSFLQTTEPPKNEIPKNETPKSETVDLTDNNAISVQGTDVIVYRCELCDFVTSSQTYLASHRRGHDSYKRWTCSHCPHRSNWKSDILKHIRKIHPGEPVIVNKMDLADAMATLNDYMKKCPERRFKHRSPHSEKLMYKCSLCSAMSMLRTSISKHIRNKHIGQHAEIIVKQLGPPIPGSGGTVHSVIPPTTPHERIPESPSEVLVESFRYSCGHCPKRCINAWGVKRHYSYCHPGVTPTILDTRMGDIEISEENELVASPSMPDLIFADTETSGSPSMSMDSSIDSYESPSVADSLAMLSTFNPRPEPMGKIAKLTRIRPFKCSVCDRRSNWKWDMTRHLKNAHPGEEGRVITLTTQEAINEPVINASPIKPGSRLPKYLKFQCSACGKRSAYSGDIRKHIVGKHPGLTVAVMNLDHDNKDMNTVINSEVPEMNRDDAVDDIEMTDETTEANETNDETLQPDEKDEVDVTDVAEEMINAMAAGGDGDHEVYMKGNHSRYAWICSKCSFSHKNRTVMLEHLTASHNAKAYSCKFCNCTASHRSALYRHLRSAHACTDYKMCIEVMQYRKLPDETVPQFDTQEDSIFYCRICSFETKSQTCIRRHLREKHQMTASVNYGCRTDAGEVPLESIPKPQSRYNCNVCPYGTNREHSLKIHKMNHQPHPNKQHKCDFCPYYVAFPRLIQQHMLLHVEAQENAEEKAASAQRKYPCDKCPYTTNCKNDYLFHKQFHRPRPNAVYKCSQCDYWVTLKRLLAQHSKLHSSAPEKSAPKERTVNLSPTKSDLQEVLMSMSPIEITELKQKIITSRILPHTPMELTKDGDYVAKIHKCRHCPYSHFRVRNVRFHEQMHGWRQSDKPLYKCTLCDYYVGSKGLLSHHLKVHLEADAEAANGNGKDTKEDTAKEEKEDNQEAADKEEMLEMIRYKRYPCEKCPYATSKRSQIQRHSELHASKQRYVCKFCDYSVPTNVLVLQHQKLHMSPNYNLLATQSVANLQRLPVVTAEVAVEATLNSKQGKVSDLIHDDLDLYENMAPETDNTIKKPFCCDRCPYTNIRRDYLLSHIKLHLTQSELKCSHCSYSVAKPHLLAQHTKIHFAPLPELTEWLEASGLRDRDSSVLADPKSHQNDKAEPMEVSQIAQNGIENHVNYQNMNCNNNASSRDDTKENNEPSDNVTSDLHICRYCDREFVDAEEMECHELLHLADVNQGDRSAAEMVA